MTSLTIAATAERTGVSPRTLRYYERIGHLNDCLAAINFKIDLYRRTT